MLPPTFPSLMKLKVNIAESTKQINEPIRRELNGKREIIKTIVTLVNELPNLPHRNKSHSNILNLPVSERSLDGPNLILTETTQYGPKFQNNGIIFNPLDGEKYIVEKRFFRRESNLEYLKNLQQQHNAEFYFTGSNPKISPEPLSEVNKIDLKSTSYRLDSELIEGRNVKELLKTSNTNLSLEVLKKLIDHTDLVHQNGFIINDIKPDNYIYDGKSLVCIDWDMSEQVSNLPSNYEFTGTPWYKDPRISNSNHNLKDILKQKDYFAIGISALALLSGVEKFEKFAWNAENIYFSLKSRTLDDVKKFYELITKDLDLKDQASIKILDIINKCCFDITPVNNKYQFDYLLS